MGVPQASEPSSEQAAGSSRTEDRLVAPAGTSDPPAVPNDSTANVSEQQGAKSEEKRASLAMHPEEAAHKREREFDENSEEGNERKRRKDTNESTAVEQRAGSLNKQQEAIEKQGVPQDPGDPNDPKNPKNSNDPEKQEKQEKQANQANQENQENQASLTTNVSFEVRSADPQVEPKAGSAALSQVQTKSKQDASSHNNPGNNLKNKPVSSPVNPATALSEATAEKPTVDHAEKIATHPKKDLAKDHNKGPSHDPNNAPNKPSDQDLTKAANEEPLGALGTRPETRDNLPGVTEKSVNVSTQPESQNKMTQVVRTPRQDVKIDSSSVIESVANFERRSLGSVVYEPGKLLLKGHELDLNCVLQVRVSQEYLRRDVAPLKRRELWGTQVYTDDSDLVAVLAHEGLLPEGEPLSNDLNVEILLLPVLEKYVGSYRHGLNSREWHTRHDGISYMVLNKPRAMPAGWSFSGVEQQMDRIRLLAEARKWNPIELAYLASP